MQTTSKLDEMTTTTYRMAYALYGAAVLVALSAVDANVKLPYMVS